jgi:hypothetical protein
MYVQMGNDNALAAIRGDDDSVEFVDHPGEHVTTLVVTEGVPLNEAFNSVIISMQGHMKQGAKPAWIESDSPGLQALLEEHYGLAKAQNKRPKSWGKETGSHLSIISDPDNKDLHHMRSTASASEKE